MLGFIGNIGPWEIGLVLVMVLIIFGPGKLPKVGESIGKAIKGFQKASKDDDEDNDEKSNKE
ncbi:MAG: twin-arginine translocase TatA/TatE family subunit [Ignavibacteriales bacterium]